MTTATTPSVATPISAPTGRLSDEDVAFFHREGYLSIAQLTTPEDVAFIKGILDELFAHHRELPRDIAVELGSAKDMRGPALIPQLIHPNKLRPELLDSLFFRNARRVAEQLTGRGCHFYGAHSIYKPPHNQKETPWHQDMAYWAPGTTSFCASFWMPLADCPVEAGCMQFIPRSHLGNLLPHHPAGHDPNMHALECDAVDVRQAVACPLPAGGATVQQPKTLHYTGPNSTQHVRPTFILNFGWEWRAE